MSILESDQQESHANTLFSPIQSQPSDHQSQPSDPHQLQSHHIRSIDSTVVIRQLRSLGLSFQLWPAATSLVNLLSLSSFPSLLLLPPRPRVLELGSGTGLVGISFAAALGCHVTLTDLPHVLPNLRHNVGENAEVVSSRGGECRVVALGWGEEGDMEEVGRGYDLILGSDVVYYEHLFEPLLRTLRYLMAGEGGRKVVFVMGHLRRWKKESAFFKKARKVFDVSVIHKDEPNEGERLGVVVYRFKTKTRSGLIDGCD